MSQILIAAAFGPELEPISRAIGLGNCFKTIAVGVGLVESAANTGFLLSMNQGRPPAGLVFVGSCGANDKTIPLGSVVIASEARLSDETLAHGSGYIPELCTSRVGANQRLSECLQNHVKEPFLHEPLYSSLAITRNESVAQSHRRYSNARLENLELFGVAIACRNQSIPWAALSIVTNHTWERGHLEWKENHERAAQRTAQFLIPSLPALLGCTSP